MSNQSSPAIEFGLFLRSLRHRIGMSQADLAAGVGFSEAQISRLEQGKRLPVLEGLAERFIPALGLQDDPHLAVRLIELASQARGEKPPTMVSAGRSSHVILSNEERPTLPAPPTPLLGRDDDVRALCNRILGHSGRLMTLLGPPGIGKSRLALEIATRLQNAYRDGALFVALASLDDADLFPITLARALQLPAEAGQPVTQRLIGFLRRKEMLLVLDNFEQIISAAPVVAELLSECAGLRALVTSRERLHLRAEQRVRVHPLDEAAAAALFVQRTQAVNDDFELTAENQPIIAAICRLLDCLPLAIELSAARMDLLSLPELQAGLNASRLNLLNDGHLDLPPHQRTLAAAIQRSYQLLSIQEQQLFRRLGVFAGSFDAEAVTALGGDSAGLRPLTAHSLLQSGDQHGEVRYRLLETLREFAAEQLADAGEDAIVRRRQLQWLLALARQADRTMRTADRPDWLCRLDDEMDNLRGALGWAVQHEPEMALALAGTLHEFWYSRGYYDEGLDWLRRTLAAAPDPSSDRVRALSSLGQLLGHQGACAEAQLHLGEAMEMARSLHDRAGLAEAQRLAGWVAYDNHERAKAVDYFQAALTIFQATGDSLHRADALAALAHMGIMPGSMDRAQIHSWLEESLEIYRSVGDIWGRIFVLHQQGELAVVEGAYTDAIHCFEEALKEARALGQKPDIAWGLELLGEAQWLSGNLVAAENCWQEAYQIFLALGNREAIAITQHHLGQVARRQGQWDKAVTLYTQSLAEHRAMDNRHMTARCLAGLGAVALGRGERDEAARLLDEAKAIFDSLPSFLAPVDAAEFAERLAATEGEVKL